MGKFNGKVIQFENVTSTLDKVIYWIIILSSLVSIILVFFTASRYTPDFVIFTSVFAIIVSAIISNIIRILTFGVCYTLIQIAHNTTYLKSIPLDQSQPKTVKHSSHNQKAVSPSNQIETPSEADIQLSKNEERCSKCGGVFIKNAMFFSETGLICQSCDAQ